MHTKLQGLFDEHASPQHAAKRSVHDRLSFIVRLAGDVSKQIIEERTLLVDATFSPEHDPAVTQILEPIIQAHAAAEREVTAMSFAARELGRIMEAWDMRMTETPDAIKRHEKAKAEAKSRDAEAAQ